MRSSRPRTVVSAVVLLLLGAVALLAVGVAAVVLRDNDLARLPVLLFAVNQGDSGGPIGMDTDPGLVLVVVGSVTVVVSLLVGCAAVATARGSRVAWAVVVVIGAVMVVAAGIACLASSGLLRWSVLVAGLLLVLVSGLLLSSSARAYVRSTSHERWKPVTGAGDLSRS